MIKKYKDYDYLVYYYRKFYMPHFCGYVKLPDNHPYNKLIQSKKFFGQDYEIGYDDMNIDCHGGLTFSRHITEETKDQLFPPFTLGN